MKKILDVACGGKSFYFDKNNPLVCFCDKRKGTYIFPTDRVLTVDPDVICDFTKLPFEDEQYKVVVFDPPHIVHGGEKSWLVKKYGLLDVNWKETIKKGFNECWRVLAEDGVLVFKWNETQIKVSEILDAVERIPILGHKSGKQNKTHWLLFFKNKTE